MRALITRISVGFIIWISLPYLCQPDAHSIRSGDLFFVSNEVAERAHDTLFSSFDVRRQRHERVDNSIYSPSMTHARLEASPKTPEGQVFVLLRAS